VTCNSRIKVLPKDAAKATDFRLVRLLSVKISSSFFEFLLILCMNNNTSFYIVYIYPSVMSYFLVI
jgi:hypothetical protein